MSEDQTQPSSAPAGHTSTIVAGLVVLVCLVGAAVALAEAGWDSGAILGLLSGIVGVAVPVLAAVKSLTDLRQATDAQSVTLAKIDHQTNGVLNQRIRNAVHDALNAPIDYLPTDKHPDDPA